MDTSKKFVITINREVGSGGNTIGKMLAEKLHVNYYDKAAINALVDKFNLSVSAIERMRAEKRSWWTDVASSYMSRYDVANAMTDNMLIPTSENMYRVETEVLKGIADNESCVIAGRSGFSIFKNTPNSLKVFIQSAMPERIARVMEKQGLSEEEARKIIKQIDEGRENYTKRFSGSSRYDCRNYDLVINVTRMTEEEAVDLILSAIDKID